VLGSINRASAGGGGIFGPPQTTKDAQKPPSTSSTLPAKDNSDTEEDEELAAAGGGVEGGKGGGVLKMNSLELANWTAAVRNVDSFKCKLRHDMMRHQKPLANFKTFGSVGVSSANNPVNASSQRCSTCGKFNLSNEDYFFNCGVCDVSTCASCHREKVVISIKQAQFEAIVSPPLKRLAKAIRVERKRAKEAKNASESKSNPFQLSLAAENSAASSSTTPSFPLAEVEQICSVCNVKDEMETKPVSSVTACSICGCTNNYAGAQPMAHCAACLTSVCINCRPIFIKVDKFLDGHEDQAGEESDDADEAMLPADFELKQNEQYEESHFLHVSLAPSFSEPSSLGSCEDGVEALNDFGAPPPLIHQTSIGYNQAKSFEPLATIADIVRFVDKNGNSAAHYAGNMGLHRTVEKLVELGASKFLANKFGDTPSSLQAGLPLSSSPELNKLHNAIAKRGLLSADTFRFAHNCSFDFRPPKVFEQLIEHILGENHENEHDADFFSQKALDDGVPSANLYRAVFLLRKGYGKSFGARYLVSYLEDLLASRDELASIDPLYYYARFMMWKFVPSNERPSTARRDRLLAADALTALRLYPNVAGIFLDPSEKHDEEVAKEGIDSDQLDVESSEDTYEDLVPPPGYNDPEMVWERAKVKHNFKSPAMDELMKLIGLKEIKEKAIQVCLQVLLKPPPTLKTATSMNFLFVGNPGR